MKYRVQFYGPTLYIEADSAEDAEDLAVEYLGDEFPSQDYAIEAEADDDIPNDLLVTRE